MLYYNRRIYGELGIGWAKLFCVFCWAIRFYGLTLGLDIVQH